MEATRAASRVSEIRIGLGGAAPIPVRARQAEAVIKGRELTDAVIRDPWGAEVAATAAEPLSDLMGSADYRRQMIRVWERRPSGLLTALRPAGRHASPCEGGRPVPA